MADNKPFVPSCLRVSQLLERHFDTAFAAPDGIKKLRELILTLAMRGELVAQDPKDPPASELLREIKLTRHVRRSLGGGGRHEDTKTRRKEELPPIKPEEVPYKLPKGWEWVRLGCFLQMINGRAFKPSDWITEGLPIVRIQNLNNPQASFNYCNESDVKEQHLIENGEFLISWSGTPGTSFGAFIWSGGKAVLNQHIFKCFQIGSPCDDNFLRSAINGRLDFLISQAQGAVGLKHVTKGTLENMLLPLPPLPEQQRIVARIDQLMGRCDALEKLRAEREEKRHAVHAAAIRQLLTPSPPLRGFVPSASAKAPADKSREPLPPFAFLAEHFGELYTVKENVTELRKAILQLAVMGRLVEQDPNDPPASELLKEIEREKASHDMPAVALAKAGGTTAEGRGRSVGSATNKVSGNTRRKEELAPIKPEDVPYKLPKGWEWVRLVTLADIQTGKKDVNEGHNNGLYPFFSCAAEPLKSNEYSFDCEALLLPGNGANVGLVTRFKGKFEAYQRTYVVNNFLNCSPQYVEQVVKARFVITLEGKQFGSAINYIKLGNLTEFLIPLPPLPEQHRIVARIDQLMTLCDRLEQQIAATTGKQTELLNAVMAQSDDRG